MTTPKADTAIGQAIRHIREVRGLNQGELADSIEISRSHLSMIERGHRVPSLAVLGEIAESLEVTMAQIMRVGDRLAAINSTILFSESEPQAVSRRH